jgi:hypothetical protein
MSVLKLLEQYLNYYECAACNRHWYKVSIHESPDYCNTCSYIAPPMEAIQLPDGGIDELAVWQKEFQELTD